ncbi:MAG: L,D-transpeptidase family protein [Oscillospiraceae bacterium]|nr:L,D-transpeptidase family protein [Oscillospiraceae bacterium]
MKHRVCAALLAALLCLCLVPSTAGAAEDIPARHTKSNGNPYYIMVNRKMSTVTIYGLDENGFYSVPLRAMLCSAGAPQHATPKGNCSIGNKYRWHLMMGGVYAQYLSQFRGSCLFHSVCYARPQSDTLLPGYYDNLGAPASHGCVRLQTEDAKWIYENCATGTLVTIYDSDNPGELGKPEKMVPAPGATNACRWDPTDPLPENPWAESWTTDFALSDDVLVLAPGEILSLSITREPQGTTYPTVMYISDCPAVAVADGTGSVRAVGVGSCTVSVRCGDIEKLCTVVVSEAGLAKAKKDAWYSDDIRYLGERGLISESGRFHYAPCEALTHMEALELLYRLSGASVSANSEQAYYDTLAWAALSGFPTGKDDFAALSRSELIGLLYLFDRLRATPLPNQGFSEEEALEWAVKTSLMLGDVDGELYPDEPVTRAQAAAILHRYCELFDV